MAKEKEMMRGGTEIAEGGDIERHRNAPGSSDFADFFGGSVQCSLFKRL
jgi:hypothetical protein